MKYIYFDDSVMKSAHAARGVGAYTKNLSKAIKKALGKDTNLSWSSENYDLIHYPFFDLFFNTLKISNKKTVITIHDVIPLIYPKAYPPGIRGQINFVKQKSKLKKVDAIMTVSETSKKDIIRLLGVKPEKVHVAYNAPNFKFKKVAKRILEKTKKRLNLPDKFILYVGDVNYNKNLLLLCDAAKKTNTSLVIVGKQATEKNYDKEHVENKSLRLLQKKYSSDENIVMTGYLSDEDLNAVWNLATVYCQPSLYEGFGIAILESMQASVPVIASKTQALVEVAGEAALYFEPKNIDDLSKKILELYSNQKLRKRLIDTGQSRAKRYSWDQAAKKTIEVYKKVLFK